MNSRRTVRVPQHVTASPNPCNIRSYRITLTLIYLAEPDGIQLSNFPLSSVIAHAARRERHVEEGYRRSGGKLVAYEIRSTWKKRERFKSWEKERTRGRAILGRSECPIRLRQEGCCRLILSIYKQIWGHN